MKKITRKALLTAKLYRPGKAGGGSRFVGEPDAEGKIYHPTDRDINLGHFLHGNKVRNKDGDHVPVYHITPKNFSQFKPGGDDPSVSGPVIFLSPNREYLPAGHNAGGEKWGYKEGANVMPLWVNLKNPLVLDDYGKAREVMNRLKLNNAFPYYFTHEDRQALINEGYDGVINGFSGLSGIPHVPYEPGKIGVGDQPHGEEEIVAFHPNQVKSSIGNRGTYDPGEDDINKAAGGRTGYADGGTPARVVDQNNFYSKADHEARKLSQKKGSPQQIRAMLEKAGVKPEEIDQSGYNETFGDRPSVTTQEVAQHFRDKLPKLNVKRLLSGLHEDFDPDSGDETRFDPYTLHGQTNYREHLLKLPAREGEPAFQESNHWPGHKNVVAHIRMGDRGTPVDPEMAKATTDKMLADKQMMSLLSREPGNWGSGAADLALERGTITPEEALNLSRHRRWHNDVTANAKPEKNLHVEEIQSDWAQQGRKKGFADPGVPPKPTAAQRRQEFQAFVSSLREPFIRQYRENMRETDTPEERDAMMQMVHHLTRDMNTNHTNARLMASALGREDEFNRLFQNWIDAPIEPENLPRGPFVTSTPGWTNLALKHVLNEAVKGGYDRIVFSPGQANSDMYGGLDEAQEEGLKGFYDKILPTQMNKLVKSLDPDHPGMRMFSHHLPPVALSDDTEGYKGHALDITDDLRDAVNKGLPMFKRGGEVEGYADGGSPDSALEDFYGPTADEHRGRWYTGTSKDKDFTAFQESRHGTWLTRDPEEASQYAMQNDSQNLVPDPEGKHPWSMKQINTASRVIPAFVRVEKPYTGPLPNWAYQSNYKKAQSDWFDLLRSQGYDAWAPKDQPGILVKLTNQGTHIKSAIGNSGAYDRSKKHLAKSEGGYVVDKALKLARNLTRR